jgi:hypothetical protein
MGTRSRIGRLNTDGSIDSIYCHWDGYPEHHFPILCENYNTPGMVQELLNLRSLSTLGSQIGVKHDFDGNSAARLDWCRSHWRDRGDDAKVSHDKGFASFKHQDYDYEWAYLYDMNVGEWVVYSGRSRPRLRRLTPAVSHA